MTPTWLIGADIGQAADYSAFVFVQVKVAETWEQGVLSLERKYEVRHIERPKLGMRYLDQIHLLQRRMSTLGECTVIADSTGCGRPVLEMMRREGIKHLIGVTITGGESTGYGADGWRVPKRDLVSALQLFFQSGRLRIAGRLEAAEILKREVLNFRVKIKPDTGNESFGAWRESEHDDLVLALALACWWGLRYDVKEKVGSIESKPYDALRWGLETIDDKV